MLKLIEKECCEKCSAHALREIDIVFNFCKDSSCECHAPKSEDWEREFDNGVALKIGKAGKSEGIINVRKDIKSFIRRIRADAKREERAEIAKAAELLTGFTGTRFQEWLRSRDVTE